MQTVKQKHTERFQLHQRLGKHMPFKDGGGDQEKERETVQILDKQNG